MERTTWIMLAIYALSATALFAARNWIRADIERSVQHKFDAKLEVLKTDLRKSEELLKGNLRLREGEIATLRDGILSGRMQRQALLDKRRLDSVECVWNSVIALAPFKNLAKTMAVFNFDSVSKEASNNAKLRETIGKIVEAHGVDPKALQSAAYNEQPFITPLAWAYFSAYSAVISTAYARAKLLEVGIEDPAKLFNERYAKDLLKEALPHHANYVDSVDTGAHHYLLDELENSLLSELREILEGGAVDRASLNQAARIMEQVKKLNLQTHEASGAAGIMG